MDLEHSCKIIKDGGFSFLNFYLNQIQTENKGIGAKHLKKHNFEHPLVQIQ
jgi:hypothetical protein